MAFILDPKVSRLDLIDALSMRIPQAHALALNMTGQHEEWDFELMNEELRREYIYALVRALNELQELWEAFMETDKKDDGAETEAPRKVA